MSQHYTHIGTLNISHDYMDKEVFDGFSISWSAESAEVLSNLKVMIKPLKGGFSILCAEPELLSGEDFPVLIQLSLKDPLFFNYTDLEQDFRPNSGVFHFQLPNDFKSEILHRQDRVSVADVLSPLNQKNLEQINAKNIRKEISVEDYVGNVIAPSEFIRYFFQTGETLIKVRDGKNETLYYKGGGVLDKIPFGLVSLNLEQLFLNYQSRRTAVPLQIKFKTRKTIWKYIISDKVYDKFSRLTVVDVQNNKIHFKEGEFEIRPAWKVRSFESEESIPYRADSNFCFQLIETSLDSKKSEKVVYKQLPEAKPGQLHQLQTNPEISYSHIFI